MKPIPCSTHRDRPAIYHVEYKHGEIESKWFDCEECAELRKTKRGAEHLTFTRLVKEAPTPEPQNEVPINEVPIVEVSAPTTEGHSLYCNCKTCNTTLKNKYKASRVYDPGTWGARDKKTNRKAVIIARIAKEARDIASQYFKIDPRDIAVSPHCKW